MRVCVVGAIVAFAACANDPLVLDGDPLVAVSDMNAGGCAPGIVYVLDASTHVLSIFDPRALAFHDDATLACPAPAFTQPFSMAVRRDGTAWVEYASSFRRRNATLFHVDPRTGACDPTPHPIARFGSTAPFGMAFAVDGDDEALFVIGDLTEGLWSGGSVPMGVVDVDGDSYQQRGFVDGDGELGADAAGDLYAFVSWATDPDGSRIERVDKTSGQALGTWVSPSLAPYAGDTAIVAWGGALWLFASADHDGASTSVFRFEPSTATLDLVMADTGRHIIGAGVAPCN